MTGINMLELLFYGLLDQTVVYSLCSRQMFCPHQQRPSSIDIEENWYRYCYWYLFQLILKQRSCLILKMASIAGAKMSDLKQAVDHGLTAQQIIITVITYCLASTFCKKVGIFAVSTNTKNKINYCMCITTFIIHHIYQV